MQTRKVLLVDDVLMFLEIQKGFLTRSPLQVLTARDGDEALQVARTERPDLVFMDLHMPRMNGAVSCAAMKADPDLRCIPVIMVTSAGKDEDQALCLSSGCDDFITKPLDKDMFLCKARTYLPDIERREPRFPMTTKVSFSIYGVTLSGVTADICSRGVFIASPHPVEERRVVEISFQLPDAAGTRVDAKGRVAWINAGPLRPKSTLPEGFGVEFVITAKESTEAIKAFLAQRFS